MYGIDVGTTSVKAVRGAFDRERPAIQAYSIRPLEEGVFGGNFANLLVNDRAALRDAIAAAARDVGARGRQAAITLPDQYVKLFFLQVDRLQDVTPAERRYTEWRLKQMLPARVADGCVVDYQVLTAIRSPEGVQIRVVVQLVREEVLNGFAELLVDAGVEMAFCNCDSLATANYYHDVIQSTRQAAGGTDCCLVHIGNYSTTFSFLRNEVLEYVRILDYACQNFTDSLAAMLETTPREARQTLRSGGLIPGSLPSAESVLDRLDQFHQVFEEWFREIGSTFSYYRTNHPSLGPVPVLLAGGGSCLDNLSTFLERLLELPVHRLDPAQVADLPTLAAGEDPAQLVPAAGIAMTRRQAALQQPALEAPPDEAAPEALPPATGASEQTGGGAR